jgi:hypothetical protein
MKLLCLLGAVCLASLPAVMVEASASMHMVSEEAAALSVATARHSPAVPGIHGQT